MATGTITQVMNNSGSDYCKMPDGTLICWGHISTGALTTEAAGSMWKHDYVCNILFPVPFAAVPAVSFVNGAKAWGIVGSCEFTKTAITYISYLRPTAGNIYGSTSWIAIGRWK